MAAVIDVWNQALSECGARATVESVDEVSKEAQVCQIHYDNLRTSILRGAPWACARFQALLTKVEAWDDTPADNQYPWAFGYTYPSDCLKVRYILEAPLDGSGNPITTGLARFCNGPRRDNRFIPALSEDGTSKVILTNIRNAIGVYTRDLTDVNLWDQGLWDAITSALCAKIVIPLTGNVQMKGTFEQLAMVAIREARAQDGNEAMPTTDHTPDWLATRGIVPTTDPFWGGGGYWYSGFDRMSWGE